MTFLVAVVGCRKRALEVLELHRDRYLNWYDDQERGVIMTQDTRVQETWTYAGVRVGSSGKKIFGWQDPQGELLFFSKMSGGAIGGQYEVMVQRSDDGTFESVSPAMLTFAGTRCDDTELVAKWQIEHRLAEVAARA